jgi:hypothetical protein
MRLQTLSFLAQVPFRLLKKFHNVQQRLVRELEKKFQGRDVVIIGNRRIMPPPKTGYALARPRSRTLSAVRFYLFTHSRTDVHAHKRFMSQLFFFSMLPSSDNLLFPVSPNVMQRDCTGGASMQNHAFALYFNRVNCMAASSLIYIASQARGPN